MSQRLRAAVSQQRAPSSERVLDIEKYLPFLLVATGNRLSSTASRHYLSQFGVGVTAWRVLANLKARPGMTGNDIAASSELDKGAVSRAVGALMTSGHVALDQAQEDQRKRPLRLTPKGIALHDRILVVALGREQRLLKGLAAREVETLFRLLTAVYRNALALD